MIKYLYFLIVKKFELILLNNFKFIFYQLNLLKLIHNIFFL